MHTPAKLLTAVAVALLAGSSLTGPVRAQSHFEGCSREAEHNATLIFPAEATLRVDGQALSEGDEIAVFSPGGACAGVMVWKGAPSALTIWADDALTEAIDGVSFGETFTLRVWHKVTGRLFREVDGHVHASLAPCRGPCRTDKAFATNAIYELSNLDAFASASSDPTAGSGPREFGLADPYPNPFNPRTTFTIRVEQSQRVTIQVFDALGRSVTKIFDGPMDANAERRFAFEAANLASGLYFIRAVGEHFENVRQVVLTK